MPTFMTEATARSLYKQAQPQTHDGSGVIQNPVPALTYSPEYWEHSQLFNNRKDWLVGRGLVNNASVLVVGCGYGALIKILKDLGVEEVYGLDPGPWIHDNLAEFMPDAGVRSVIGDDWIGSGTEQATLNSLGASGQAKFTFVVDEDAAPAHTDTELPAFISGLEDRLQGNVKGRIVHMVTPLDPTVGPGDSSQNWKTIVDWKAVAPDHTWIDTRTGEIA